jgi:hypothetical protein
MDKLERLLSTILCLRWEWGMPVLGDDACLAQLLSVLEPWHTAHNVIAAHPVQHVKVEVSEPLMPPPCHVSMSHG